MSKITEDIKGSFLMKTTRKALNEYSCAGVKDFIVMLQNKTKEALQEVERLEAELAELKQK